MAYDDPQLLHLDKMLTDISVAYDNEEFVGERLFPTVRVNKQSDKYYVQERRGMTVMDDIRAPKGRANEMPPMKLSRDSYFTEEHALVDMVSPEEQAEADDPIQPLEESSERTSDTILMNRENFMVDMVRTTGNYATNHVITLSGTSQWSDYTNSDPIANIKTGRDRIHASIQRTPNTMIAGYEVMSKLEDHPKFVDRIKYTREDGLNSDQVIARLVGVGRIIRGNAVKNTAALGQTEALSYMWGKDVVLAYVPARPGRRTPAFAYEFAQRIPAAGGQIMPTERWWDNDHRAWKIRVLRKYDLKFIAVDAVATGKAIGGYLIKNAIA